MANLRLFSDVGAKMSMFDQRAKQHEQSQLVNPFSDWSGAGTRRKLSKDDPDYGKPVEGSKTAERGRLAQIQMIGDMVELCDMIHDCGIRSPDGRGAISFGDAFRLYSSINDKVVGLLMRGRKHKILDFEGEMLFQGRDDATMIELLLPLNTIRHKYGMPERAGCGDVREDLIKALAEQEKQQKQQRLQRRTRSMGIPEVPTPTVKHQKSHSIDDTWVVDADVRGRAEQRGRSLLQCPTPGMGRSRSVNADNSFGARPRDVTPESMYSASDDEASSVPGIPPCLPEEGPGEDFREGSTDCTDDAEKIDDDAGGGEGELTASEFRDRIRLDSGGDLSKLSRSPCTDFVLIVPTISANGQVVDLGNEETSLKGGRVDENPESIENVLSEDTENHLSIASAVDGTDLDTR